MRNIFLSTIVLPSILSAALGAFWIGSAEANLGIEICTAQGIKTVPAASLPFNENAPDNSSKQDSLSQCLICAYNKHCPPFIATQSVFVKAPLQVKPLFYAKNTPYRQRATLFGSITPRAPPAFLF